MQDKDLSGGRAHPGGDLLFILEGSLDGYRRFVEELFPRLAPHMLIAATLPARLTGTLILNPREGRPDISPYVAWHLEPLPPGSENELLVEIGRERAGREYMLGVLRRTQSMRLEAAAWISSPSTQTLSSSARRLPPSWPMSGCGTT